MRTVIARGGLAAVVGISLGMAAPAYAQGPQTPPARPVTPGATPAAAPVPLPSAIPPAAAAPAGSPAAPSTIPAPPSVGGEAEPAPAGAVPLGAPGTMDEAVPVEVPADLVQIHPGGLTAEQAGVRASTTSWNAKASEDTLRSAEARVDEAWAAFLPRLSGKFEYERLSEFTPPVISLVPLNEQAPLRTTLDGLKLGALADALTSGFGFPLVFNNWTLQGTLTVPISDYFLSIGQKYTAATRSQDAARWNLIGARASAMTDGKAEYYTWLRNRGAVIVAVQALNDQNPRRRGCSRARISRPRCRRSRAT
jgi:outer membrane protein TolC